MKAEKKTEQHKRIINAAAFDVCERVWRKIITLKMRGRFEEASHSENRMAGCEALATRQCPRAEICRSKIFEMRRQHTEEEKCLNAKDVLINGTKISHGVREVFSAEDDAGNQMTAKLLDTDLIYSHESGPMRDFLDMWSATDEPNWNDLNFSQADRSGWLDWVHFYQFDSNGRDYFRRYAPNMVRLSGLDHTGLAADYKVPPVLRNVLDRLRGDVAVNQKAIYGHVQRKSTMPGGVREASMRRLELPIFQHSTVVGSIIMLMPDSPIH